MKPSHAAPPPRVGPEHRGPPGQAAAHLPRRPAGRQPHVRKKAARGLGYLGSAAAEAVPALRALCEDEHRAVRQVARWALNHVGARS